MVQPSNTKILNLVLRESFDLKKLSAVPRAVWEIAQRADSEYSVRIISNSDHFHTKIIDNRIELVYVPGSLFSFFDNTRKFLSNQAGIVHFFGSLSGAAVFSSKMKEYQGEIFLNIINGAVSVSDFRYLRWIDIFIQPFNNIFHPSVLGIPFEFIFMKSLRNKNISNIIVQSNRLLTRINKRIRLANIVRIPYGIKDVEPIANNKELYKNNQILYFGHSYTVRGIDDLISCLDLYANSHNEFQLNLIVTPETNLDYLNTTLVKHPLVKEKTTITASYLDDLPSRIKESSLCVFLYRFPGEIPEYPFALIEAMSLGVPVITTRIGAITELFDKDSPCLTEPGNLEDIYSRINIMMFDNHVRAEATKRNLKTVSEMTWDKCYSQLRKLYKSNI